MARDLLPRAMAALTKVKDDALSDADRLDACRVLDAAMAALTQANCVSADELEGAQRWRDELREYVRSGVPDALRTLARLSQAAEDAAIRREASELLDNAAQRLRRLGRDISALRTDSAATAR